VRKKECFYEKELFFPKGSFVEPLHRKRCTSIFFGRPWPGSERPLIKKISRFDGFRLMLHRFILPWELCTFGPALKIGNVRKFLILLSRFFTVLKISTKVNFAIVYLSGDLEKDAEFIASLL